MVYSPSPTLQNCVSTLTITTVSWKGVNPFPTKCTLRRAPNPTVSVKMSQQGLREWGVGRDVRFSPFLRSAIGYCNRGRTCIAGNGDSFQEGTENHWVRS